MNKRVCLFFIIPLLSSLSFAQYEPNRQLVIKGRVLDSADKPVAGARITASPDLLRVGEGRAPMSVTDNEGNFVVSVLRPSRYMVSVDPAKSGFPPTSWPFYYPTPEFHPFVFVEEDKPTPFVSIRLMPLAGVLSGEVLDAETGKPIYSTRIKLCRTDAPNYCMTRSVNGKTGRILEAATASPFTVHISADGYQDWWEKFDRGVASGSMQKINVEMRSAKSAMKDKNVGRLAAPEIIGPADGTDLYVVPRLTKLEWSPVEDAVTYAIDLEGCEGVSPTETIICKVSYPLDHVRYAPTSGIKETSYEFLFIGAQLGRWRVWAVDLNGRPGAKSQWTTFRYRL